MTRERLSALQLMQALQLGHAMAALEALGVMEALARAREPAALARRLGLDPHLLAGLLDHAARATRLVRRQGRRYRRTRAWDDDARFLVGLYGLASAPPRRRSSRCCAIPGAPAGWSTADAMRRPSPRCRPRPPACCPASCDGWGSAACSTSAAARQIC